MSSMEPCSKAGEEEEGRWSAASRGERRGVSRSAGTGGAVAVARCNWSLPLSVQRSRTVVVAVAVAVAAMVVVVVVTASASAAAARSGDGDGTSGRRHGGEAVVATTGLPPAGGRGGDLVAAAACMSPEARARGLGRREGDGCGGADDHFFEKKRKVAANKDRA
jgi:hypothetical protein